MNCAEFWKSVPAGQIGSDGPHADHVRDCERCGARVRAERKLAEGLREVASGWRQVGAPPRLESRLVAAFRAANGIRSMRPVRPWVPALTWLTAVAAMAAVALFLVRGREPQTARPSRPHAVELVAAEGAAENPQYSDFIPLPNAARIGANEVVDLVRIEVPRSAMMAVGFEVSADRANERVEAEVVLGADGQARAVRFTDE